MKHLKLTLVTLLLSFGATVVSAQNCPVYNKYEDNEHVGSVFISKTMLHNQQHLSTEDVFIGKVAAKLDAVYIMNIEHEKTKKELKGDVNDHLKKGKYEIMMKQKSSASSSLFYVKKKAETFEELIMLIDKPERTTFVHLYGNMTKEDIQYIATYQDKDYSGNDLSVPDLVPLLRSINAKLSQYINSKDFHLIPDRKELESLKERVENQLSQLGIN